MRLAPRPSPLAPYSARAVGSRLFLPRPQRSGFTLIEMLVAVAITMIMMLAIAQIFLMLGNNMDKGRALIEMSGQLRNVSLRLQEDLDGLTCSTLPWTPVDAGDGYFEYIEGAGTDATQVTTMWGDRDDVLAFTARSRGRPFVGRHAASTGGVAESELAEIIWWAAWRDAVVDGGNADGVAQPGEVSIYRRVLLIRPDLALVAGNTDDISQRAGTPPVANSLADLTLRQNRTLHAAGFPHIMNVAGLVPDTAGRETVLNNVVGFDVRVFDPLAPLMNGTLSTLVPGDPGYVVATANSAPTGRGAYVDLGYAGDQTTSYYSGAPNAKSLITTPATYSTWPFFYERDGFNQDSAADALFDEGTDGFDTTGGNSAAADDPGEYETAPPYPHPISGVKPAGLRGIQVRIRLTEPGSRQVRQSTVVAEFLPE